MTRHEGYALSQKIRKRIEAFGAMRGFLDVRYGSRDGSACAEFSWQGNDDNDPACGRGWASFGTAGRLVGHFYIHKGDNQASSAKKPDFSSSLLILLRHSSP